MSNIISLWMRQIIDNPSVLVEFIQDLDNRAAQATKEGVKASKEGNSYLANTHFGRAEAYESLKNSILIHQRESEAQDAFQQTIQQTGKRSNARRISSKS